MRIRGRGAARSDRSQAHVGGPGRHAGPVRPAQEAPWGDERQMAVWSQVSAHTAELMISLNLIAMAVFYNIDLTRYGPAVTVFFAIAVVSTAYAMWASRRKGVNVRAQSESRASLVVQALVWGALYYVFTRFVLGRQSDDSWPAAAMNVVSGAIGYVIGRRFLGIWRSRRALPEQEAPDDALDAPEPMR